jgi:hypothetical protein
LGFDDAVDRANDGLTDVYAELLEDGDEILIGL